MTKELTRPLWYDDEFYNKILTPEEWLYEVWKRYQFNQGNIGLSHSVHQLPIKEQEECFREFILAKEIDKFLNFFVTASPPQPIRYPSVSDIFIMYHLLINTDWYKNNTNREAFESAISKIINKEGLSREQNLAFHEMYKTPWCIFYENHQQDSWCPKKEIECLTGNSLSFDPGYVKEDTITILKEKLNSWIGKIQRIEVQFDSWQDRKILAVFDLRIWFKMQGIKITNIGIHKLIWPKDRISNSSKEGVNRDDDIKHSIKLVNKVIDRSVISSLLMMCEARKFKNEATAI
ncbi:Uncharacterised protein [Legionella donaldsonii]|uniref:Uncharacterized protein n=1 Tax=Legionella donaldsonii TaxID=45060 RepID=A0A378JH11_9GAMM|nr:hypothetical protein [Legionella donaldsonii]STX43940.1 Uncharacterised protein [Legionella donaldsonii]